MKKYFCNGKPVEMGKPFEYTESNGFSFSKYTTNCMNEAFINMLINKGIVTVEEDKDVKNITLMDCIHYYAEKNNWSDDKAASFIDKVSSLCRLSAINMIAKAAAVLMDKNHPGHIMNCPKVWFVSVFDWNVYSLKKEEISDYMYLAAFRSESEALMARDILKAYILILDNGK